MKYNILIILVCPIVAATLINQLDIPKILNKLFTIIYNQQKCLYLINDNSNDIIVSRSLIAINLSIINSKIDAFYSMNNSECNGYIFTTHQINKTINWILEDVRNSRQIRPYEILTIIFDSNQDFDRKSLITITETYAIDLILIDISNSEELRIWSIYDDQRLTITDDNRWNLSLFVKRPKWVPFRSDFTRQTPFTIAAFQCTPYFYVDNENNIKGGVTYHVINEIVRDWPHNYRVLAKNTSVLRQNDYWTAVRLLVANKTTDLAPCSQWYTSLSKLNVDKTYPLEQVCLTFLVPKPTLLPYSTFILQTFSVGLWLLIIGFFVLMFIVIDATFTVYTKYKKGQVYPDRITLIVSIMRLTLSGGIRVLPRANEYTLRIMFTIVCFFGILLTTCYNAGITSLLTHPKYQNKINTIDDMVKHKLVLFYEDYLINYFRNSSIKKFNDLAQLSTKNRQAAQCISTKRLRNNYLTDIEGLYDDEMKKLTTLQECFDTYYVSFGLKKHSPFTRIFDDYYSRFTENGLLLYWFGNTTMVEENFVKNQSLLYQNLDEDNTFNWKRFKSALFMLIIGDSIAILVFICEYCFARFGKKFKLK